MGAPSVGSVILVPFPFSNLSASKLRPALIMASSGRGDWICAQITSQPYSDPLAIKLDNLHFQTGSLSRLSFVRPGKLFTANESIFQSIAGTITDGKLHEVRQGIIALLQNQVAVV